MRNPQLAAVAQWSKPGGLASLASRPASLHNWIGRARYGSGCGGWRRRRRRRASAAATTTMLLSPRKFMSERRRRRIEIVRTRLSPAVNDRYLTASRCCCCCCWHDGLSSGNLSVAGDVYCGSCKIVGLHSYHHHHHHQSDIYNAPITM